MISIYRSDVEKLLNNHKWPEAVDQILMYYSKGSFSFKLNELMNRIAKEEDRELVYGRLVDISDCNTAIRKTEDYDARRAETPLHLSQAKDEIKVFNPKAALYFNLSAIEYAAKEKITELIDASIICGENPFQEVRKIQFASSLSKPRNITAVIETIFYKMKISLNATEVKGIDGDSAESELQETLKKSYSTTRAILTYQIGLDVDHIWTLQTALAARTIEFFHFTGDLWAGIFSQLSYQDMKNFFSTQKSFGALVTSKQHQNVAEELLRTVKTHPKIAVLEDSLKRLIKVVCTSFIPVDEETKNWLQKQLTSAIDENAVSIFANQVSTLEMAYQSRRRYL